MYETSAQKMRVVIGQRCEEYFNSKDEPYNSGDQQIITYFRITSVLTHFKKHYLSLKFGDQDISKHLFQICSEKKFFSTS